MFFLILARDKQDALALRLQHRQAHLNYWTGIPGVVKVAGALLSGDNEAATPCGSALMIEAKDLEAARALLAGDPFTAHGVFGDDVRIEAFRPSIGDWKR